MMNLNISCSVSCQAFACRVEARTVFLMGMGVCRKLAIKEIESIVSELGRGRNPERDTTLFYLGCYTGGRISSILILRICDVVELDGSPVELLTFRRSTTKGKIASHSIHLSSDCRQVIAGYIEFLKKIGHTDDLAYLFTTRWGSKPISRYHAYHMIHAAADRLMLRGVIGTHSMRKTFASTYYQNIRKAYLEGMVYDDPLESLRAALGHANIQSTSKYLAANKDTVARFTRMISYK